MEGQGRVPVSCKGGRPRGTFTLGGCSNTAANRSNRRPLRSPGLPSVFVSFRQFCLFSPHHGESSKRFVEREVTPAALVTQGRLILDLIARLLLVCKCQHYPSSRSPRAFEKKPGFSFYFLQVHPLFETVTKRGAVEPKVSPRSIQTPLTPKASVANLRRPFWSSGDCFQSGRLGLEAKLRVRSVERGDCVS